jgi:hypothetical protein
MPETDSLAGRVWIDRHDRTTIPSPSSEPVK